MMKRAPAALLDLGRSPLEPHHAHSAPSRKLCGDENWPFAFALPKDHFFALLNSPSISTRASTIFTEASSCTLLTPIHVS